MKTLTINAIFAVAALTVAAAGASAQTYKAAVPMSFQAGDKLMPAGSYELRIIHNATGKPMLAVRNSDTHAAVLLNSSPGHDLPKTWRTRSLPVIAFNCAAGSCTLGRMWDGYAASTYDFPAHKISSARVETASLLIPMTKAD